MGNSQWVSEWIRSQVTDTLAQLGFPRIITRTRLEFEMGIRTRNEPASPDVRRQISRAVMELELRREGYIIRYCKDNPLDKNRPRFRLVRHKVPIRKGGT